MQKQSKLLLHACCAPCASAAIRELKDYSLTLFFYNPNIFPEKEYQERLSETRDMCEREGISLIEGTYDHDSWLDAAKQWKDEPEGGKRCEWCYLNRLERTARVAKDKGFDIFATTLTLSPHKDASLINSIGSGLARKHGIKYLESNFKKKGGYNYSIEYSKKHGMKRQDYCGCEFSMRS